MNTPNEPTNAEAVKRHYRMIHSYIWRNWGNPRFCSQCLTTSERRYEWANVSEVYTKDIEDYLPMCVPCHRSFDYSDNQRKLSSDRLKKNKIAVRGKVAQYSNGKLVKIHESLTSAARSVGVNSSTLSEYFKKDWNHVGGYQWKRM